MRPQTLNALKKLETSMDNHPARFDLLSTFLLACLVEIDPTDEEEVTDILRESTGELFEVAYLSLLFSREDPRLMAEV